MPRAPRKAGMHTQCNGMGQGLATKVGQANHPAAGRIDLAQQRLESGLGFALATTVSGALFKMSLAPVPKRMRMLLA